MWQELAKRHHDWVESVGWHNKSNVEYLGLICSEIGELVEAKISGEDALAAEELADVMLRVFDFCLIHGLDVKEIMRCHSVVGSLDPRHFEWNDYTNNMLISAAHAMNFFRKESDSHKAEPWLARLLHMSIALADECGVDVAAECRKKMDKNDLRGTRGRSI